MPQFFFHLRGSADAVSLDELGVSLPDAEAAYLEAFQAAKDMAQDWLTEGRSPRDYVFEVMNTAGELVLELPFSEALDHHAGRRPVRLPKAARMVWEQGERMVRLTTEVAEQVKAAQENLRRSQELLQRLGTNKGA